MVNINLLPLLPRHTEDAMINTSYVCIVFTAAGYASDLMERLLKVPDMSPKKQPAQSPPLADACQRLNKHAAVAAMRTHFN